MLIHFVTAAWRSLAHRKTYTFIHLSGLVTGISSCLLLAGYLGTEFSYDQFHASASSIYRVNTNLNLPDQQIELSLSSGMAGPGLTTDFPEVEEYVRISKPWSRLIFRVGDQTFFEKNIIYADNSFFSIFNFPLLYGNKKDPLGKPNQVVLSQALAKKYFKNADPTGETIYIDNQPFSITGVASNSPANSHISYDAIISFGTWIDKYSTTETNWSWYPATTYVRLRPYANFRKLNAKLDDWLKMKMQDDQGTEKSTISLQPFTEIHFSKARHGDLAPVVNKSQMVLLMATGIFILLIAGFNYVNLSIAISADRDKEIGVRKALGAGKRQIAIQFLTESILLCGLAVLISLGLAKFLTPIFGRQVNQEITLNMLSAPFMFSAFLFAVLIVGPLAGFYPSLIISRLKVTTIFSNRRRSPTGHSFTKRFFIAIQFIVAIGLIISTIVIWQQQRFLTRQTMGFATENKMVIRMGNIAGLANSPQVIKEHLLRVPGVRSVALSSHIPAEYTHGVTTSIKKNDGSNATAEMELNLVDFDFIELYGLEIIAGRKFSPVIPTDSIGALIINETALHQWGFAEPEDIIGKDFSQWERQGKVIGVVKDFNQHSLHSAISPMTFQVNAALFEKITIGYNSDDLQAFTRHIEQRWREIAGSVPFDFSYMDDWIGSQYEAEKRFANLFISFTLLAILIACFGIFGLTRSAVSMRKKEIGIRKVLGSSVTGIVSLFSKDIAVLVVIAMFIASPIAWYFIHQWLEHYAYHIRVSWWVFAVAGGLVLAVTLVTASFQAIKAALMNPVKSLRTE